MKNDDVVSPTNKRGRKTQVNESLGQKMEMENRQPETRTRTKKSISYSHIGLSSEMSSSLVHSFFPSEMEEKFRVGLIILLSSVYGTFK